MSKRTDQSFVTLATNDNYALGALALAQSLRNTNTDRLISIMITNSVSLGLQEQIRGIFDHVEVVDVMNSNDMVNLELLKRPELGVTFTKIHCWRLVRFQKCVFLDADCLVMSNVDSLFERDEFSAAADVGWPDCFNSGVFVFTPSVQTYSNILHYAVTQGSFDGGDQGLLNSYFSSWSTAESSRRLPFIYNMTTNVSYSYAPAFKQFKDTVKIVHFIGAQKPWYYTFNTETQAVIGPSGVYESEYLVQWWTLFMKFIYPKLDEEIKNRLGVQIVVKAGQQTYQQNWHQTSPDQPQQSGEQGAPSSSSGGVVIGSNQHQNLWEQGQIEYTGRDSFSNIQAHIDSQLKK